MKPKRKPSTTARPRVGSRGAAADAVSAELVVEGAVAAPATTVPAAVPTTESPQTPAFGLWQNLRARLVWVYEGPPQRAQGHTSRGSFTAWCLRKGQVNLRFGEGPAMIVPRGFWVLMPPGQDERQFSADAKILSVYFDARWITGEDWLDLPAPLVFGPRETTGWYRAVQPMLRIVRREFATAYSDLPSAPATFLQYAQLQGYFMMWLGAVAGGTERQGVRTRPLLVEDDRALRIREYLDVFPLHRPLRIEELAASFHLSVSQLGRVYYAQFGHSPREYFEQRRLRHACTLLGQGSAQVKEVSYLLGFKHTSQLSSWFRSKTGKSPLQFRNG